MSVMIEQSPHVLGLNIISTASERYHASQPIKNLISNTNQDDLLPPPQEDTPDYSLSNTRERILETASKNSELLNVLQETSDAPQNLNHHRAALKAHGRNLTDQQIDLDKLKVQTQTAYAKHSKYRNTRGSIMQSTFTRLAYVLTFNYPTYTTKAKEYEETYISNLTAQQKSEQTLSNLQRTFNDLISETPAIESKAHLHGSHHAQLDNLYTYVFSEPTPTEFPAQESARLTHQHSLTNLSTVKQQYETEQHQRISHKYSGGPNGERERRDPNILKDLALKLKIVAVEVEESRQELEIARQRVFEDVVGFGVAAPAYTVCCNRAEFQDLDF